MKRKVAAALLGISLLAISPFFAQTPNAGEEERINALIKEIQTQQATIADNQTKLEERLAALAETIRQARIYASRGGK